MRCVAISLMTLMINITAVVGQVVPIKTTWQVCDRGRCVIKDTLGTGTIVGRTDDGKSLVLTAKHVLQADAGSQFVSLKVADKPPVLLHESRTHDLSLVRVDADLGKPMPVSDTEAHIGSEYYTQGYDLDKTRIATRSGVIRDNGKMAVVVAQGNSGGPISDPQKKVMYGVITSISGEGEGEGEGGGCTYFVCAKPVASFLRDVVPFGWIAWHQPTPNAIRPPQSVPPQSLPGTPPGDTAELRRTVSILEARIKELESKPPPIEQATLTEDQITQIVQQWFTLNKSSIASPPPQIKVEAWEQTLDADGKPVGKPVLKGQQTYPAGTPIKILHSKLLPAALPAATE